VGATAASSRIATRTVRAGRCHRTATTQVEAVTSRLARGSRGSWRKRKTAATTAASRAGATTTAWRRVAAATTALTRAAAATTATTTATTTRRTRANASRHARRPCQWMSVPNPHAMSQPSGPACAPLSRCAHTYAHGTSSKLRTKSRPWIFSIMHVHLTLLISLTRLVFLHAHAHVRVYQTGFSQHLYVIFSQACLSTHAFYFVVCALTTFTSLHPQRAP
jgi:hypothetical protein